MRPNEIHPGDLVAGKYRVRAILGRSHGLLVDAFHTEFEQRVAIKILPAGQADDKEVERFRREARTLAKLESEHVARIIDVGMQPDGSFYLVRQFLEGTDLATHMRQRGALPLAEAVLYVLQTAEAIAETHSHGIIVRELQPSDLFLTQRPGGAPLVKLIDFGTAKLMRDSAAPGVEATATAMFGLSPYSSPELMRKAKNVDVRTDVWSLGAILYTLLAGRPPFAGDAAVLMLQISREDPVPLTQLRPDLPPDIDSIIGWALAKDVDARFRNVHAFVHSLAPFARGEGELLIQRIGQTTENARKRRVVSQSQAPAPAPSSPGRILPAAGSSAGTEDSSTRLLQPGYGQSSVPGMSPALERHNLDPSSQTAPFPGGSTSRSGYAGPTSQPGYGQGSATSLPGYGQGSATSLPGYGQGAASQPGYGQGAISQPGYGQGASSQAAYGQDTGSKSGRAGHPLAVSTSERVDAPQAVVPPERVDTPQAVVPPSAPVAAQPAAPGASPRSKTLMFALMGVAAALVPVVIGVLLFTGGKKSDDAVGPEANAPIVVPTVAAASTTAAPAAEPPPAATTAPAEPPAAPPPAADPVASAPAAADPAPTPAAPVAAAGGKKPTGGKTTPTPPPAAPPTPPPPSGGGGGTGTLMAVAMGGSCAFSVDGSGKGTSSSMRVSIAAGRHTVTCKPPSGAAKSKSVLVKSGETAMTTFKL